MSWATNATAGLSYHNYGLAIDVAIMENGQPNWKKEVTSQIAEIGTQQGFSWGASFGDKPHFEMSFGQSVNDLFKNYNRRD